MPSRPKPGQIRAVRGPIAFGIALALAVFSGNAQAQAAQASCVVAHEQGQLTRLDGRLVESREQLRACTQSACPRPVRDDCAAWLAEVERALPSVVFAVDDGAGHDLHDVRVGVAGRVLAEHADGRAVFVNPGVHHMRFEAAEYAPLEQDFTVREGEKQRLIHVSLRRIARLPSDTEHMPTALLAREPSAPRTLLRTSGALAGVGVAALAAGTAFAVRGQHMAKHCDRSPPAGEERSCSAHFQASGRHAYVLADVGFATGGALLGVAVITLWRALHVAHTAARSEPTPALSASFERRGFLLALTLPTSR